MDIIISNNADSPIYEQIKEQIKLMILNGDLKEGDALPSMRLLAKELRISIITTKRAYEELEREGYIESFTGKGSFVKSMNTDMVKENLVFEIETLFEEVIDKAVIAKLSYEELTEILKLLYDERKSQDNG
ncbi:MAG: GntR family transcriptional regulator [Lachnospiraceae bacterium]|nr:GntR family transcriptional regulator [Lachnospiraceae bacterium]